MTTIPKARLGAPSSALETLRPFLLFAAMAALIGVTGLQMGWNYALTDINMGLISASWRWREPTVGLRGLFNVGIMGFRGAWRPRGGASSRCLPCELDQRRMRVLGGSGWPLTYLGPCRPAPAHSRVPMKASSSWRRHPWRPRPRAVFDPGVAAVEDVNCSAGNLGGLGLRSSSPGPGRADRGGRRLIIGKTALGCGRTTSPSRRWALPRSSWQSSRTRTGSRAASRT
jgi:hypothetical protein